MAGPLAAWLEFGDGAPCQEHNYAFRRQSCDPRVSGRNRPRLRMRLPRAGKTRIIQGIRPPLPDTDHLRKGAFSMDYVASAGLRIAKPLHDFVNDAALPGTGISPETFWSGFAALLKDLAPQCKTLLKERDRLQTQIDTWHKTNKGKPVDTEGYLGFLRGIGYLVE